MTEELPHYEATVDAYVDGNLYKSGETFRTDKPAGSTWIPLNAEAKAAVKVVARERAAELKAAGGDADVEAAVSSAVAKVRSEFADEIATLTKRAEAAEAKIKVGDDEALDALADENKALVAENADLKARLKVFEPFDGDSDGKPGGSVKQTGEHGAPKK